MVFISVALAPSQGTGSIFRENHSKNLHPFPLDYPLFSCNLGIAENGELEEEHFKPLFRQPILQEKPFH